MIFRAIKANDAKLMSKFLQLSTNFNIVDEKGETPLSLAIKRNNPTIVKSLLDGDSDVHRVDRKGFNPFHLAAVEGNTQIIQMLIEHGALLNSKVKKGTYKDFSALDLAIQSKKIRAAQLLHSHNVQPHALEFPSEWL